MKKLTIEEAATLIAQRKESNHSKFQKTWNDMEKRLILLTKISVILFMIAVSAVIYVLNI